VKFNSWIKSIIKPSTLGGLAVLIMGVHIILTGNLRSLVQLGDERYIIGGAISIFGIIILVVPVAHGIKKAKRQAKIGIKGSEAEQ
jgi:hypothetical protein